MPITNVYNMAGEKVGEIELSAAIFGIEPNKSVLHDSVKNHLAANDAIVVIDEIKVDEIKTQTFKKFLDAVKVSGKALVVTETVDEKVVKSARNIAGITTTIATILSPYMILNNRKIVVSKAALAKIEEVYA